MSGVGLPTFGGYFNNVQTSGVGLTPGSGARGAYAEFFSATAFDLDAFSIRIYAGDGTYYGIVDIATGAAAGEVVRFSLPFNQNAGSRSQTFCLPWHVPAGTRIAACVQSSDSTNGVTIYLDGYARTTMVTPSSPDLITYGMSGITGVAFTGGAGAGIQQITAATTRPHRGFILCLQETTYFGDEVSSLYLYTGGSGAEVLLWQVAPVTLRGEDYTQHYFQVPVALPQGTRLSFQWVFGGGGLFNQGSISMIGY